MTKVYRGDKWTKLQGWGIPFGAPVSVLRNYPPPAGAGLVPGEVLPDVPVVLEVLSVPPSAEPEPTVAPPDTPAWLPDPATLSEVEAIICGVFGAYCYDALAVARCESGDDYWASVGVHAGTFQLSVRYHAGKFAAHGWDIWADGSDFYANSVVAFEIFAARGYTWLGTSGWPNCGLRAGY